MVEVVIPVNGATVSAAIAAVAAAIAAIELDSIPGLRAALDAKASAADLQRVSQLTVVNALIFG
ncbi:hypothetical protein [Methylobacterium sp. WL6]|uniref:hypothetical protein n=1 Tax=Methylobacterium sp. WL6 TaxID=2603901 RepID=UPI0011C83D10|nr:hypothetical protein [Methylobacterium sp. WL6]TXN64991.1 hypothetical protein FV230_17600 [Methylobacterium sp. WL6]